MNIDKITPQNDVAFKIIFADEKHKNVLMHFLNSAIDAEDKIVDVEIMNGEITKEHVSMKGSRLDILAKTNSNHLIDIEMQVSRDPHMVARTLYYWAKLFSGQLIVGDDYEQLRKTITINILNFRLFGDDAYWRKCCLSDKETMKQLTDLLEIQFLELNKMRKLDENSPITFWVEFFKDPYSETCKELYKIVPELKEAKDILEMAKADPEKRKLMQDREDAARNYANDISQAKKEGEKIGIEKGEKIGLEKGKAEGEKIAKVETAKNLLKIGLTVDQIAQATGLSIEDVSNLVH